MAEESAIAAEMREDFGSASARRLRNDGRVPAALNKADGSPVSITINAHDFEKMLHHHTSETIIVNLKVGSESPIKALVKDVQHDPISGKIMHVDFLEISMTEKMQVDIALSFVGEPVGVTQQGGILEHVLREVEVECLPADLVESIEVDVSGLEIGDSIQVSDLVVDPKLTVLTASEIAVAAVAAPRLEEEPEPAEGEEGEVPEGEEGAPEGEGESDSGEDKDKDEEEDNS